MLSFNFINVSSFMISFLVFPIASFTPAVSTGDDVEVYYPTDCYNARTKASYPQLPYCAALSTTEPYLPPDLIASINPYETVEWYNSWTVTRTVDPFAVSIEIGYDAPQTTVGETFGSCTSSDFVGVKNCYKQARRVLFRKHHIWIFQSSNLL